jgi:hypothetical protein
MQANRRTFLKTASILTAAAGLPKTALGVGSASEVQLGQLVYSGGNWRPRVTALRRLAWEIHKRTAADVALEPMEIKSTTDGLALSPLVYVSGDRAFPRWGEQAVGALGRFLRLGGTLIVDPAYTPEGNIDGFEESFNANIEKIMPGVPEREVSSDHVIYRSFYQLARPVGRVEGPDVLKGYEMDGRLAVIRAKHDLGGAWARDNLGSWEFEVTPGGDHQRENAFRLGINIVLYVLCLDYKNEKPHRRFNKQAVEE